MTPLTERDFMRQVTDLAELRGWSWAHFRPAMTEKGWRTPVSGPLGAGWPDLVLVNPEKARLIFAELKSARGKESVAQTAVLDALETVAIRFGGVPGAGGVEVHVWRPADWSTIEAVLR